MPAFCRRAGLALTLATAFAAGAVSFLPIWVKENWGTVTIEQALFFLGTDWAGTDRAIFLSAIKFLVVYPLLICGAVLAGEWLIRKKILRSLAGGARAAVSALQKRNLFGNPAILLYAVIISGGIILAGISARPIVKTPFWNEPPAGALTARNLIARAGGPVFPAGAKPLPATNSLEAVKTSLRNGFKFINLELTEIPGPRLVAARDETAYQQNLDSAYPPINDLRGVRALLDDDPQLRVFTDKSLDYELLKRDLPYPERILVTVFSLEAHARARELGFCHLALRVRERPEGGWEPLLAAGVNMVYVPYGLLKSARAEFAALHQRGLTIIAEAHPDLQTPSGLADVIGVCADLALVDYNMETGAPFTLVGEE